MAEEVADGGDLVVGFVALLDGKIVIFEVNIQVRKNEALANPLPDNARHLVPVHFDDGVGDLDFGHVLYGLLKYGVNRILSPMQRRERHLQMVLIYLLY